MDKKFLKEQKEKLEKEKQRLEKKLDRFGKKDQRAKTDWITKYPKFDGGRIEEEADEVEEYDNLLSINYAFEKELKNVLISLEKIKKASYGVCGNCQKAIPKQRLKIYPQAQYCTKCQN